MQSAHVLPSMFSSILSNCALGSPGDIGLHKDLEPVAGPLGVIYLHGFMLIEEAVIFLLAMKELEAHDQSPRVSRIDFGFHPLISLSQVHAWRFPDFND